MIKQFVYFPHEKRMLNNFIQVDQLMVRHDKHEGVILCGEIQAPVVTIINVRRTMSKPTLLSMKNLPLKGLRDGHHGRRQSPSY